MASDTGQAYRRYDELWQRSLTAIGIKVDIQAQNFSELAKAARAGQIQLWSHAWTNDTADEFMQLFFGPNSGAGNLARFRNEQFDALYRQSRRVPEGPGREKL